MLTFGPPILIFSIGALICLYVALLTPSLLFGTGIVLSFSGGVHSNLIAIGYALMGAGLGGFLITRMPSGDVYSRLRTVGLLSALLVWIGSASSGAAGAGVFYALFASLIAVVFVARSSVDRMVEAVGRVYIVFIGAAWLQYLITDQASRFAALSGNPNRLAFGVALMLPFGLATLKRSRHLAGLKQLALVIVTGHSIFLSESRQGMIAIAITALLWLTSQLPRRFFPWALISIGVAFALVVYNLSATDLVQSDLTTLGDRLPYYYAAVETISNAPVFGSGATHVSGLGLEGSAHSTPLALMAQAGVLAGLMWLAILLIAISRVARLPFGHPVQLSLFALALLQLVQNLHHQPLSWLILAAAIGIGPKNNKESGNEECTPTAPPARSSYQQFLSR
ncbi:O-antigen ligase family protein [Janibacter cremeus]|uniref:O-antigen ligase family protein n=1 Tax=Janibacter cremeus TaxID=1285192 RepID=UPI0023F6DCDA|nr:O-antigen ligase family protein [Janibacter cremeus]WEV78218.1 O-antigen ligase family protein [Janibacter cremeus]WEV78298.1 O-antigen ligase family protein [Janibacter cremeus]